MIAGGAFMMLGSGTCDPGEPYSVSAGDYLISFTSPGATGGMFPWTHASPREVRFSKTFGF